MWEKVNQLCCNQELTQQIGLFTSLPVPVWTISGPDDWSRSRFNFVPGTGPGPDPSPVAWLLDTHITYAQKY